MFEILKQVSIMDIILVKEYIIGSCQSLPDLTIISCYVKILHNIILYIKSCNKYLINL